MAVERWQVSEERLEHELEKHFKGVVLP